MDGMTGSRDPRAMGRVRSTRRRNHEIRVAAEVCRLEDRCLLSAGTNQFPAAQVTNAVPVSSILWNGGPAMPGAPSTLELPLPVGGGRDEDHHAHQQRPGDGLSFHPRREHRSRSQRHFRRTNITIRSTSSGSNTANTSDFERAAARSSALPKGATITFQVPLVLWDGDNFFIATDPNYLTSNKPVYNYNPAATIAIAGIKTRRHRPDQHHDVGHGPLKVSCSARLPSSFSTVRRRPPQSSAPPPPS